MNCLKAYIDYKSHLNIETADIAYTYGVKRRK